MVPLRMGTYWSTQITMEDLINTIITPHFEQTKQSLGLPSSQHSVWKINCWSVHWLVEFPQWMNLHHSNIIIVFIPGRCTGLWQPLDVGIQHILKLSLWKSAHQEIVYEVL
jgi:hypothetical protein